MASSGQLLAFALHVLPAQWAAHAQARARTTSFQFARRPLAGATVRVCIMRHPASRARSLALIYSDARSRSARNHTSDGLATTISTPLAIHDRNLRAEHHHQADSRRYIRRFRATRISPAT